MAADSKIKYVFVLVLVIGLSFQGKTQKIKDKADSAFELLKYNEAIELYSDYLEKHDDLEASKKLAAAYYYVGSYDKAEGLYKTLVSEASAEGEVYLKYANVLILNNKKEKAKSVLSEYIISHPSTDEYKRLFKSVNIEEIAPSNSHTYVVTPAQFNSSVSDYSPIYYQDKLMYTSQNGGKEDPWTGRSFSNIYITDDKLEKSFLLEGNLNGKFHNGTMTFVDESTMVFTRNNSKKGDNQDYNLILAFATRRGDKWNFEKEFQFNDRSFSNAYPTYLPEAEILIFSSDRPGGFGGMDLYYTRKVGQSWSTPENLGDQINTSKDEIFPYVLDGVLYFSSNGYPGLGGLDIFKAEWSTAGPGEVKNLPSPINSNRDDFGLITQDNLLTKGYLSSNREGNGSSDNIYRFEKIEKDLPPQEITIAGKVIDEYTKIPLKETTVTLTNDLDGSSLEATTGEDGRFSFNAKSKQNYTLTGIKNGISTTSAIIETTNTDENYYYTLLHNDPRFSLEGFAVNNKTDQKVEGVTVINFNKSKNEESTMITNQEGFFKFQLDQDSDFEISGTKGGYYTSVSEATTKGLNRSTTLYVKLYLSIEEVIIGDTKILGKETFGGFDFDPVYYDLDKADIRPDAALALDKVVSFMNKNPTLKIELGSHTDCRAGDEYNKELSDRRAASAVAYIVNQGVPSDRIFARGYGERNLVNRCADGIRCSENEHQENRRTEIKVIGYKE